MLKGMKISMRMDRGIDRNKHYISPGGFEVETVNGDLIEFDFMDSVGYISKENNKEIEFDLVTLDTETYPEATKLNPKDTKRFTEIFVYTGETNEPEINVEKILKIILLSDNDSEDYVSSIEIYKSCFQEINKELRLEAHVRTTRTKIKEYLTDELLKTTDFNENQYDLLRELMTNEDVLKAYSLTDLVDALTAPKQELIGFYDFSYYRQYLKEYNGEVAFEDIPNGSFNHNDFNMYKTKDGESLIEIQL